VAAQMALFPAVEEQAEAASASPVAALVAAVELRLTPVAMAARAVALVPVQVVMVAVRTP
jgi:hypothetical protein